MEKSSKNLLDPEQEERLKVLDTEIAGLKEQIEFSKKTKNDLEK